MAEQDIKKEPVQEPDVPNPSETEAAEPQKEDKKGRKVSRKELEEVQAELEKTQKELAALKDQYLRTRAEYDNFRKRTEREKAAIYGDGTSAAIKGMLPVADNLERALAPKRMHRGRFDERCGNGPNPIPGIPQKAGGNTHGKCGR